MFTISSLKHPFISEQMEEAAENYILINNNKHAIITYYRPAFSSRSALISYIIRFVVKRMC